MEAVILAGGQGTRLKSAVNDRPKPLADINGKPFLSYLMEYWIGQGVKRFILSVGYRANMIREYYGDEFQGISVVYAVERIPSGTGGGLILSLECLNSPAINPFLLINGDTFFAVNLDEMISHHNKTVSDMTIACRVLQATDRYGIIKMDNSNRVLAMVGGSETGERLINGGVYLINREMFSKTDNFDFPVSFETEIIPALLRNNRKLSAVAFNSFFIDIGVPEDYQQAQIKLPVRKGKKTE